MQGAARRGAGQRRPADRNRLFATPMRAVAAASWSSAWRMSGRRSNSADGTPGRHLRQRELLEQRTAARHRLGRAADQHADRVLRLLDLALGLHHRLGGLRHEDLRLADVDHAGDTARLAHLHELQVLLARLERALGDLQLVVERAEVEVRGRHVGHQGAEDEAPRVHRGQQVGARRFGGSPETAPEIDLERQVEAGDRAELILGLEERALTLDIACSWRCPSG